MAPTNFFFTQSYLTQVTLIDEMCNIDEFRYKLWVMIEGVWKKNTMIQTHLYIFFYFVASWCRMAPTNFFFTQSYLTQVTLIDEMCNIDEFRYKLWVMIEGVWKKNTMIQTHLYIFFYFVASWCRMAPTNFFFTQLYLIQVTLITTLPRWSIIEKTQFFTHRCQNKFSRELRQVEFPY